MIKLNKMFTPELLKKGAIITGIATSVLPVINSKNQENTTTNVLEYMDKSPATLSNRAFSDMPNPLEVKELPADFFDRLLKGCEVKISSEEDEFFDPSMYEASECITDEAVYKEVLDKFKNPNIKKVIEILFEQNALYENNAEILYDIEVKSRNIEDKTVLAKLEQIFNEIISIKPEDDDEYFEITLKGDFLIHEAYQIVEAYNTIKGNYVQYKKIEHFNSPLKNQENLSTTQEYLETRDIEEMIDNEGEFLDDEEDYENVGLRENLKKRIFDGEKTNNIEVEDFLWAQKCEAFETLRTDLELKQYLYKILLKELKLPAATEEKCIKILEEYNVMVIPYLATEDINIELEAVRKELSTWTVASNGKAKLPELISLNSIKKDFLFDTVGQYHHAYDMIELKNGFLNTITFALRHEIMHRNDLLKNNFSHIGEELVQLLAEIMPIKQEGKLKVRDYEKCKYREEFLKAGISPAHISYAYTDRAEFIAVAAEGDVSRYSPEFREVLIKLGMPSYVFDLQTQSSVVTKNCKIYDEVIKENPEVTDYRKLARLYDEKILEKRKKNTEKLLKMIFGDDK